MTNRKIIRRARKTATRRQEGRCFWCDVDLDRPTSHHSNACTADHVVPRSLGGKNKGNIVSSCLGCNQARGNNPLEVWLVRVRFRLEMMGNVSFFEVILSRLATWGIHPVVAATPSQAPPFEARPSAPDGTTPAPLLEDTPR